MPTAYEVGDILQDIDWDDEIYIINRVAKAPSGIDIYYLLDIKDTTREIPLKEIFISKFYKKLT